LVDFLHEFAQDGLESGLSLGDEAPQIEGYFIECECTNHE
jgi:hypothetical protein